jgi:hypothetical protein
MTVAEVAAANEAGAYSRKRVSGGTLLEDLKLGEVLLFGSNLVVKKYGLPIDRGQPYNNLFAAWKLQFGFPSSNDPAEQKQIDDFHVDAKYCAKHIEIAREIIAAEPPKWRASVGVGAVAKRLRERFKAERAKTEGESDDKAKSKWPKTESADAREERLRGENGSLRSDLITERAAHAKTQRALDDALRNPLAFWQVSANEAAIRLHQEYPDRGRVIMAALIALNTPGEKASASPVSSGSAGRCQHCSTTFDANRAGKRFCSDACRRAAAHARRKAAAAPAAPAGGAS